MLDLKQLNSEAFISIEKLLEFLEIDYELFGDNIYCPCPIHDGDNDRGFSISKDLKMWKCWTRNCNEEYGNDTFGLVRGVLSKNSGEDAGFKDALRAICKALDVNSKNPKQRTKGNKVAPSDFVKMVNMFSEPVVNSKTTNSVETISGLQPSEYFMARGFSLKTLEHFGVGDCYNKGSDMYQRAVTPIHNDEGHLSAYIGRAIRDYRKPKFLFTSGFDKRKFLYNYHRASIKALDKSCMFITEGQGDTWRLFECGIENSVGIFGKSLTKEQERKILDSGITKIVVLTDNDQAGRESKVQMQRKLARNFKLFFPRFSGKDIGDMSVKDIENKILPQVKGLY